MRTLTCDEISTGNLTGLVPAAKSTLAAAVAHACTAGGVSVTVVEGDEFYAGGTAERSDQRSPVDKADASYSCMTVPGSNQLAVPGEDP